jgi:hypothetical protein
MKGHLGEFKDSFINENRSVFTVFNKTGPIRFPRMTGFR